MYYLGRKENQVPGEKIRISFLLLILVLEFRVDASQTTVPHLAPAVLQCFLQFLVITRFRLYGLSKTLCSSPSQLILATDTYRNGNSHTFDNNE